MDPSLIIQMKPYQPWLFIAGVFLLFFLLRLTRRELRRRVDEFGVHFLGERGLLIWFWMNAPGVMLHELSHAFVVMLLYPFGFRITHITLFRIKPITVRQGNGQVFRRSGRQSLQLGEVQYVRPPARLTSHVGDGLSAIAPLFGGIFMLSLLYWIATGYNIWDINLQLLRPGWPWWTLTFSPYLILTVTSELWPSRQDWRGARWFVFGFSILLIVLLTLLWYTKNFVFDQHLLLAVSAIATHIDFALLILVALDLIFLAIAEVTLRLVS